MHRLAFVRWGAAALVALVTSVIVASDLAELHRRARAFGPERTVVVAEGDLALGTTVHVDDLTTRKIHASQLPEGVATSIDDVIGRVVVVPVLEGSFVTPRHLAPAARTGLDAVVPRGSRAIRLDPASSPTLRAGELVDVIAGADAGGGMRAKVVAEGALVLGIDDAIAGDYGARAGVTLLVRASEAGDVAEAVTVGAITLALTAPDEAPRAPDEFDEPGGFDEPDATR